MSVVSPAADGHRTRGRWKKMATILRRFLQILRIFMIFSSTLLYGKLKTVVNTTRG